MKLLYLIALALLCGDVGYSEQLDRKACVVEQTPVYNQRSSSLGVWNPGFESFIYSVQTDGNEVVLKETSLPGNDWVWMPGVVGEKARDTFHTPNSVLVIKESGFWYSFVSEDPASGDTIAAMITGSCHELPNN